MISQDMIVPTKILSAFIYTANLKKKLINHLPTEVLQELSRKVVAYLDVNHKCDVLLGCSCVLD